ncbi:uncharacterized protein LOC123318201 isoform X2 [Coccinella septempunctata]|nr:uncharacterized protein LOC123318201 isoform X2 [Coccinella septempunctata]
MLHPISVIHNLAFLQCVQSIIDDNSLDTNIVLFMEDHYEFNIPVITTGLDDFKKSILFKSLDKRLLTTTRQIFYSAREDMSSKNMRHFTELKKDTVFVNVSSGQIKVGEFRKFEVQTKLLGSCSNERQLRRSISSWLRNRKRWRYKTISVCYTYDPPFTMNHLWDSRKGMVLDIHEMIHEKMGIRTVFKRVALMEKRKKKRTEKRLQGWMKSRFCDYFLQGTMGRFLNVYDFTTPSFTDNLFWYAPTAEQIPKWKYIYQILSKTVWYSWISTIFALLLFWCFTNVLLVKTREKTGFFQKLWALYKLAVEQDVLLKPRNVTETIVVLCLILESLVMNVAYKCKFIEFLSEDNYENQLNSLEDVMRHDLKIGFLPMLIDLFTQDEKMTAYLKTHAVPCDFGFTCIDRTANAKDMVVLRAKTKLLYLAKRYTDEDGRFKLKRIGAVVSGMTFNSIFRRGHPLYPMVESVLLDLLAHGFVQKVTKDYARIAEIAEETRPHQALTMTHLRLSFAILVCGWIWSGLLFVYEVVDADFVLRCSDWVVSGFCRMRFMFWYRKK